MGLAAPTRNVATAACVAFFFASVAFTAVRLERPASAGSQEMTDVYRSGPLTTPVRVGPQVGAPFLGAAASNAWLAPFSDAPAQDGWIHVRGRDWQGWVSVADLLGPYQRMTHVGELATLDRLPEL